MDSRLARGGTSRAPKLPGMTCKFCRLQENDDLSAGLPGLRSRPTKGDRAKPKLLHLVRIASDLPVTRRCRRAGISL